jgi:hypothetical protein
MELIMQRASAVCPNHLININYFIIVLFTTVTKMKIKICIFMNVERRTLYPPTWAMQLKL